MGLQHYSPAMVALVGLLSLLGFWGVGAAVLAAVRLRLPQPWKTVAAALLGVLTVSLSVQGVAMAGVASPIVLRALWALVAATGLVMLAWHARTALPWTKPVFTRAKVGLLAGIGAALLVNFLIAIAPSTKVDEIYYHMLVPARIVGDGALRFYTWPWEGGIVPQLIFQIAAAPVHALGYPDAHNVVSWGLAALLAWFAARLILTEGASAGTAAVWTAGLCVGLYPAVWLVTGGAQAFGDLATAVAVVALADSRRLLTRLSPPAYLGMVSVLTVAATASKVSLAPASLLILAFAAWRAGSLVWPKPAALARLVLAAAAPWLVLYAPLVVWTWLHSGSPLGPMLAGRFGPSAYNPREAQAILAHARATSRLPITSLLLNTLAGYSPLLWIGAAGALVASGLDRSTRLMLSAVLGLQLLLILTVLPTDPRFLGGLPAGLMIVFAAWPSERIKPYLAARWLAPVAAALFILPWFAVQLYYAKAFVPVALGLEREAFYRRNAPLYDDDLKLDRILKPDAVILSNLGRSTNVYLPRPVVFSLRDLPPGRPVVLLSFSGGRRSARREGPSGLCVALRQAGGAYTAGEKLYSNPAAVLQTLRTPGAPPQLGPIEVWELKPR